MKNKAQLLAGLILLMLQVQAQGSTLAEVHQPHFDTAKDVLLLQTNGADRRLLQKILASADPNALSEEERARAIDLLIALEDELKTQSIPWRH